MGDLASSTKKVVDDCRGAAAGGTILKGLKVLGPRRGWGWEKANLAIMKMLASTSWTVLNGSVTFSLHYDPRTQTYNDLLVSISPDLPGSTLGSEF